MPPRKFIEPLNKSNVSAIQRAFLQAVERLGLNLDEIIAQVDADPFALARAVRGANWEDVFAGPMREAFEVGATKEYHRAFRAEAVKHGLMEFFSEKGNVPFARAFIDFQGALLVRNTDRTIRRGIVDAIQEGFKEYESARDVARAIIDREIIGLDPRLAKAVMKRGQLLRAQGLSEAQIAKRTAAYSKRLLRYRARNIARSEMIGAANQGHLDAWDVGMDRGLIDKTARKRWIAGPGERTCPICRELHGKTVPVKNMFHSTVLGRDLARPAAHPSCRCTMVLLP